MTAATEIKYAEEQIFNSTKVKKVPNDVEGKVLEIRFILENTETAEVSASELPLRLVSWAINALNLMPYIMFN